MDMINDPWNNFRLRCPWPQQQLREQLFSTRDLAVVGNFTEQYVMGGEDIMVVS